MLHGRQHLISIRALFSATDVIDGIEVTNIEAYDTRRFFFGIGEGRQDLPPGNALPLDSNVAFLNGGKLSK